MVKNLAQIKLWFCQNPRSRKSRGETDPGFVRALYSHHDTKSELGEPLICVCGHYSEHTARPQSLFLTLPWRVMLAAIFSTESDLERLPYLAVPVTSFTDCLSPVISMNFILSPVKSNLRRSTLRRSKFS